MPAGHSANAAYWFDGGTGDWITSTHYMTKLPTWVSDYNKLKMADKYFEKTGIHYIQSKLITKVQPTTKIMKENPEESKHQPSHILLNCIQERTMT
ncbi:hypothetical protein [Pedobacter steynii]